MGKTTLAEIIAKKTKSKFITFSAVLNGIKEIRKIMNEAEENRQLGSVPLFLLMKFIVLTRLSRMLFALCRKGQYHSDWGDN